MRLLHYDNGSYGLALMALFCSGSHGWVPAAPLLSTTQRSIAIESAVKLQAASNTSDQEAISLQSLQTDFQSKLLADLESELDRVQRDLKVQKGAYEQQFYLLEQESQQKVQEAQDNLASLMGEYQSYKAEMTAKLQSAPSAQEAARMKKELVELRGRTESQGSQLALLKKQLQENRQGRQDLQIEMIALREGYANRLGELEDALELEQNERIKYQRDLPQKMEQLEREFRQRLRETEEESKLFAEQMRANYTGQLEQRDRLLSDANLKLQHAEAALKERQHTLAVLEGERQSLRKLLAASYLLVRQRFSNRLNNNGKQETDDEEE